MNRKAWILRVAMSREEAASILGVELEASDDTINKAYRQKALENHPDRGGDTDKMVEINVAKDVLQGKQRPTYDRSPSTPEEPDVGNYDYRSTVPKREKEVVEFSEAKHTAGVPTDVDWVFKTQNAYGGFGDRSTMGYVVYGKSKSKHVFVGVEHYRDMNAFTGLDQDFWSMRVYDYPIDKSLRDLAPKVLRQAFGDFKWVEKSFNAKVVLVEGKKFDALPHLIGSTAMAFKDMMSQIGEVGEDDPWVKGRKMTVQIELNHSFGSEGKDYIVLTLNGRQSTLDDATTEQLVKNRKILQAIFGTYYYFSGSKKVITKSKNGKPVLEWMAKNLTKEPQALRDQLQMAAEQMK